MDIAPFFHPYFRFWYFPSTIHLRRGPSWRWKLPRLDEQHNMGVTENTVPICRKNHENSIVPMIIFPIQVAINGVFLCSFPILDRPENPSARIVSQELANAAAIFAFGWVQVSPNRSLETKLTRMRHNFQYMVNIWVIYRSYMVNIWLIRHNWIALNWHYGICWKLCWRLLETNLQTSSNIALNCTDLSAFASFFCRRSGGRRPYIGFSVVGFEVLPWFGQAEWRRMLPHYQKMSSGKPNESAMENGSFTSINRLLKCLYYYKDGDYP